MSDTSKRRRRNADHTPRRRNREAPLNYDRGYDVVFDQSPLAYELLAFNVHRKRATFDHWITCAKSDDSVVRRKGTKKLAKMLETDARLLQLLKSEDVDIFIGFLEFDQDISKWVHKPIQYHAAAVLTIVLSSKHMGELIKDKALPYLVKLLPVENCDVKKQAVLALTKMTYNFPGSCKDILQLKVLSLLRDFVTDWQIILNTMVGGCAMLLGAICTGHPDLSTDERNVALDIARSILRCEVMPQACVPLAKLSDGKYMEVTPKDCELLIDYLSDYPPSTIISALEVVGNIARWGNYPQIQSMIANGVLQPLQSLLFHDYKILRKEACWIISNIIAVNDKEDVIKTDLIEHLCNHLDNDELDVKIEAGWAILNLIYKKSTDMRVLKMSCWETLLRQQQCQHSGVVTVCTKAIQMLSHLVTED